MIYQQCASLRPQMCGNARTTTNPPGGCAAGCFCPDRQILHNGICIDPIACPGLYILFRYTSHMCSIVCGYTYGEAKKQNICVCI